VIKCQLGGITQKQESPTYLNKTTVDTAWHVREEQTNCYDLDDESEAGMGGT
jgi:hypothetical protein